MNPGKGFEIIGGIQAETMQSHPAFDRNADRSQFLFTGPDPGKSLFKTGLDSKAGRHLLEGMLDPAQKHMQISATRLQSADQVPHQLAGVVQGDFASTVSRAGVRPFALQEFFRDKNIRFLRPAGYSEYSWVFKQQKLVWYFTRMTSGMIEQLNSIGFFIGNKPQPSGLKPIRVKLRSFQC